MSRAAALTLVLCCASVGYAQTNNANRFTYLDSGDPFWPDLKSPKLTTPQWIGEDGVEAAVILSIDDMRDPALYEAFLRPILDRLKRIDGRAPVSILTCEVMPDDPQLQAWLKEGLSIEVHTLKHPCPLLQGGDFLAAKDTVDGCIDLLGLIPNNKPVAFRMPCCDSMNSPSPRFYSEIFSKSTPAGNLLTIDSSVMTLITPNDTSLPREIVLDKDGKDRFRKYFPQTAGFAQPAAPATGASKATGARPARKSLANFGTYIEDYPYPYVINRTCWEFPCMVPSDWEAHNAHGSNNPVTVEDWKAALDATVLKQGVFTFVFHPHGWVKAAQMVEFIDYAQTKYGKRVKFLNFREAAERLNRNVLADKPLRVIAKHGQDGSVLADVNGDLFMDVIAMRGPLVPREHPASTRIWQPKSRTWKEAIFQFDSGMPDQPSLSVLGNQTVMLSGPIGSSNSEATVLNFAFASASDRVARENTFLSVTLVGTDRYQGVFTRDFNNDGNCEVLVSSASRDQILTLSARESGKDPRAIWKPQAFQLPDNVRLFDDQGRDNGLRFVDLNGDGFDDIVFSNPTAYGVFLFNPKEKADVGWLVGWTLVTREGKAGDAHSIPPIVRADGTNNGVWFKHGAMWVQNEDTSELVDVVRRIPFDELLRPAAPPPRSPAESLAALHVRPGLRAELVAHEPQVQDPVWIDWAADGKMWVVEMADYPLGIDNVGKPGGRVKWLEDSDGDGTYEKASLFLDGLAYPTGLAAWNGGVFVLADGTIFFARDTDGDGKADERTLLFTGFAEGNPQHLANGFAWGLDGWFYGANGDSGGKITEVKSGRIHDLSGRDFRFNPVTGEFSLAAGKSQYGRWRDDFGNWFGSNNGSLGWHYLMDERYLARSPRLAVPTLLRRLNREDDGSRVFPVSAPMRRFNWPDMVNTITSACNAMPYRDTLLGEEFTRSYFLCEPANNLVHREVLDPDGLSFRSHRAADEMDREFLSSEDNWSRFSMARTGPDGCLYVVDMYRLVIEHPEWIPAKIIEHLDLRAGADRGRIYRIAPEGKPRRPVPRLDRAGPQELATALTSPNGWVRDTAQQMLTAAKTWGAEPPATTDPRASAQILWTRRTTGRLDHAALLDGMRHDDARVRRQAVMLSEPRLGEKPILERVCELAGDPDPAIRIQVALSLGESGDARVPRVLRSLALRDADDRDMLMALLTAVPKHRAALAAEVKTWQEAFKTARRERPRPVVEVITNSDPDRDKVLKQYAGVAGLTGQPARGHALYTAVCAACHRLKNEGIEIGSDLGTVAGKPTEQIVEAIIDPSRAVEARYLAHTITLKDGREVIGMVAEETTNNLTLKLATGVEVILRDDISKRTRSTRSLMPDGLESLLQPQDVADLIAWIRAK